MDKLPSIQMIETKIRQHTARAESNQEIAKHFLELAEQDTIQVEYWTEQKRQFVGETAVDNVIPFPVERRAQ